MAAIKEEKRGDKAALLIFPIGLGALLLWWKKRLDPNKAILYGVVTDAETLAPLVNINVNCDGYTGKTNAAGEYTIVNIPAGEYSVTFTDPSGQHEGVVV
jgi:hypothetical protein